MQKVTVIFFPQGLCIKAGPWHPACGAFLFQHGSESRSRKLWGPGEISGGVQDLLCSFSVWLCPYSLGVMANPTTLAQAQNQEGGAWSGGSDRQSCHQDVSKLMKDILQYFMESKICLVRRRAVIIYIPEKEMSLLIKL